LLVVFCQNLLITEVINRGFSAEVQFTYSTKFMDKDIKDILIQLTLRKIGARVWRLASKTDVTSVQVKPSNKQNSLYAFSVNNIQDTPYRTQ
jgi:hypothetical protein